MKRPFEGLTIIELAGVLAGPAVGMFFSELGARVIKIENSRSGGDVTRSWRVVGEESETAASAYYHSVNWNKEVRFVNLHAEDELREVHALIQEADVVITNFKEGDGRKYQLDADSLRKVNPGMIVAEITGFSESGRSAFDAVLQAESGIMSINGEPGGPPLKLPIAFIDLMAAHQLKEGVMVGLIHRLKTGQGSTVRVSLYKAAIASLANQASTYLNTGSVPRASGSLHPSIAPYGEVFSCSDGRMILLAVGSDMQFSKLCSVLHLEALAEQTEYSTNPMRVVNRAVLADRLRDAIKNRISDDLLIKLNAAGVPAGIVNDMHDVFQVDVAKSLILEQVEADGQISRRVATAIFEWEPYEN
jgi:crotonobetainyl-CoA:carnitine CoA-transferase CaiB-like acyl-CoA transferase